jgi:Flp pilus assembly protein TadG
MRFRQQPVRRGVTLVETAVTLPAFLLLVLGTLDLSIGLMRHNIISDAARQGARKAIVNGELSATPWGPGRIDVPATASGHPIVQVIQPSLVGFDLAQTRIIVEWLGDDGVVGTSDDSNKLEKPVRVTVQTPYRPLITYIFGSPSITLSASSTMSIIH